MKQHTYIIVGIDGAKSVEGYKFNFEGTDYGVHSTGILFAITHLHSGMKVCTSRNRLGAKERLRQFADSIGVKFYKAINSAPSVAERLEGYAKTAAKKLNKINAK